MFVRSDTTIADLHYTIQIAMGWSDVHLNRFHIHGKNFGVYHDDGVSFADNPEKVLLSAFDFRTRDRFLYEYDFGDTWLHEVRIEKLKYRSVFGDNGIDDDFDDENDPEYEKSQEYPPFDPEVFSRREVNARLRQYTRGDRDWLFSY